MKKLSLLLLFIPLYSYSIEAVKVLELDSGSCWLEEGTSKIVSFGENKSFILDEQSLESILLEIESKVTEYQVRLPKNWNLYLHCNSFATHLVFKFQGENGICAWVNPDGGIDFLGNFSEPPKGLCHGAIPGELLVRGNVPEFFDPNMVETSDFSKIILTKEYFFKEDKVIEKLKQSFPDLKIERNYMLRRVGEYLKLRSSKLSK